MDITVNGEQRTLFASATAADLVRELALGEQRLAMEINGEIVPRSTYDQRQINAGDRIEIVRAVGGG
ncbi:MAG: sulfur carrier protein ThiS [Gammaproteobacteria bacterium]|nr:sulfur carrier protein ThiS [Gammaproteobacteria bacterium]